MENIFYKRGSQLLIILTIVLFSCNRSKSNIELGHFGDNNQQNSKIENLDIYLLIGQSNMAGRAIIREMEKDTLQKVYLFNGEKFESAANPLNKYSTVRKKLSMQKLGPGYSFGKEVAELTGRKIGLVVNARGGTKIEWWEKGYDGPNDYNLYENAIKQLKKAEKYGTLKGILWLQGYANKSNTEDYMSLLKKFVNDLRQDIDSDVYFIAGELGKWQSSTSKINGIIDKIPDEINNADYVSSDGLQPLHDDSTNPHFNTKSQLILGQQYAVKVLEHIYHISLCR